jgi:hypothetical protein
MNPSSVSFPALALIILRNAGRPTGVLMRNSPCNQAPEGFLVSDGFPSGSGKPSDTKKKRLAFRKAFPYLPASRKPSDFSFAST